MQKQWRKVSDINTFQDRFNTISSIIKKSGGTFVNPTWRSYRKVYCCPFLLSGNSILTLYLRITGLFTSQEASIFRQNDIIHNIKLNLKCVNLILYKYITCSLCSAKQMQTLVETLSKYKLWFCKSIKYKVQNFSKLLW